jgi:hypothetical protein
MDVYAQIAEKIIEHQETIIGPVAVQQAEQVNGLSVDWLNRTVTISGDQRQVIQDLIEAYKVLFGQIAVEVSKEAVAHLSTSLTHDQLPALLQ